MSVGSKDLPPVKMKTAEIFVAGVAILISVVFYVDSKRSIEVTDKRLIYRRSIKIMRYCKGCRAEARILRDIYKSKNYKSKLIDHCMTIKPSTISEDSGLEPKKYFCVMLPTKHTNKRVENKRKKLEKLLRKKASSKTICRAAGAC